MIRFIRFIRFVKFVRFIRFVRFVKFIRFVRFVRLSCKIGDWWSKIEAHRKVKDSFVGFSVFYSPGIIGSDEIAEQSTPESCSI